MPVSTDLQFLGPSDIEIVVIDTGGGSGSRRVLDLAIHYDPKLLRHRRGGKKKHLSYGLLLWPRTRFPRNTGRLRFRLSRKKAGEAFITLSAVNPFTGKGKVRSLRVPAAVPT